MRKRYAAFTVMLSVTLLMRLCLPVFAEIITDAAVKESYASRASYMLGDENAVNCVLTKEKPASGEETPLDETEIETSEKTHVLESGSARAEIKMTLKKTGATDDDWNDVTQWLDFAVTAAGVNAESSDASALAYELLDAITTAQRRVSIENGQIPAFDKSVLSVDSVSVWNPYYATLRRGDDSDAVKALQQRLIELGYLGGEADGQFGKITERAVTDAQEELLEKELSVYAPKDDARQTGADVAENDGEIAAVGDAADETDLSIDAAGETGEVKPPEYVPETAVDGVAGQIFQIRLYSDYFPITVPDLSKASSGLVERFQKKLIELGYLAGSADGDFGGNTLRGVRLYQHYNGLPETGIADETTQKSVYSSQAKSAPNPILTGGSSGESVKKLQNFLIKYGFMRGSADGDYGAATTRAVQSLQTYLREKEIEKLIPVYSPVSSNPAATPDAVSDADDADAQAKQKAEAEARAKARIEAIARIPEGAITTEVTGVADPLMLDEIYTSDASRWIPGALKNGDSGLDVKRLQTRLQTLEYLFSAPDGNYGNGTESAVRAFQTRNSLGKDGVAGSETLKSIFSANPKKALKPYVLKVSVDKQRVYAYAPDENEEYTVLARTMTCSTGLSSTPTPKGTFQASTGPGARWHYFKKFYCWAQYAYYIQGDILFHSVLYGSKGGSVTSSSVRNLGSRASHGCVRLSVEDAKWIYEHCPQNTKIIVY